MFQEASLTQLIPGQIEGQPQKPYSLLDPIFTVRTLQKVFVSGWHLLNTKLCPQLVDADVRGLGSCLRS